MDSRWLLDEDGKSCGKSALMGLVVRGQRRVQHPGVGDEPAPTVALQDKGGAAKQGRVRCCHYGGW